MGDRPLRCLIVSDFNVGNLVGYLENDEQSPGVEAVEGGFGQVHGILADAGGTPWRDTPEFALVWTRPEMVIPSFGRLLAHEKVETAELLAEVDAFASLVCEASQRVKSLFFAAWAIDPFNRGMGMADFRSSHGIRRALLEMNCRLVELFDRQGNVFMLDTQSWFARAGREAVEPKLWYQAKIPYGNAVFQAAVDDVKAAIRGLRGEARKLVVLDLDNTMWGGIVGDDGWENLRLGGHDPVGEAFQHFQRELKALTRRGIILGIASKNTEAVALEAIRNHPEMVLRETDFAGWRINWSDKAANIADLVKELNLGLQSVVFIDDNPLERARVRDMLPEVLVPEWPVNPQLYVSALRAMTCFDAPAVSQEDSERTQSYVTERARVALRQQAGSAEDWLRGLGIKVLVERLDAGNVRRATQLLNKTNQLNLATRRFTEAELEGWVSRANRGFWTFRVSDRFGDAGLTGLASLEVVDGTGLVCDFVLSCRVMDRRVEETMVAWLAEQAKFLGARELVASFIPTSKNAPMLDFLKRSGLVSSDGLNFRVELATGYAFPACVELARGRPAAVSAALREVG